MLKLCYAKLVRDDRWRRLVRAATLTCPLFFGVIWAGFWGLSKNVAYAALAGAVLTFASFVSTILVARAAWASRPTRARQLNIVVVSWAVLPALAVSLIAVARGMADFPAAALGVAAGVIAGFVYARQRSKVAALQPVFPLSVDTFSEAELIKAATRQPKEDLRLPPTHRAMQRLNRARAEVFLAMRDGDFDRLVDALPVLRDVLQDKLLEPAVALVAARDLVEAQSLLVQHGADAGRYGESVELFAQLARENPEIPDAQSVLHEHRAGYHQCVLSAAIQDLEAAESAGDQTRADQALERLRDTWSIIERELRTALRLMPEGAAIGPEYLVMLGAHLCFSLDWLGEYRTDEGVQLCREALSLRAGRTREQKPRSELYLADCLVTRFEQRGEEHDLDEAEVLLCPLVRQGNPIEARARALLLNIAALRQKAT